MEYFKIRGGRELHGSLRVQGAKNSALPLLAASVLIPGVSVIRDCPNLRDTAVTLEILRHLGCRAERTGDTVTVDAARVANCRIPAALMGELRSGVIFLGALLSRCGEAGMSLPGGCALGPRPVDFHGMALRQLGAEVHESGDGLVCCGRRLRGTVITLPYPSVGATENALLAAVCASGETRIRNAAREPEILDLCRFLQSAGGRIGGAGTGEITVQGVTALHSTGVTVSPDRIAAATYLCACAAAGGDISLYDCRPEQMEAVLTVLRQMGCTIETGGNRISCSRRGRLRMPLPVTTMPYPGFPTDAQPLLLAAMLKAEGEGSLRETVFQQRFGYARELEKLGAVIVFDGQEAHVRGVNRLRGARLLSPDLRGGAALCTAALSAEGESRIEGLNHIDRGYAALETALEQLGADIRRERTGSSREEEETWKKGRKPLKNTESDRDGDGTPTGSM